MCVCVCGHIRQDVACSTSPQFHVNNEELEDAAHIRFYLVGRRRVSKRDCCKRHKTVTANKAWQSRCVFCQHLSYPIHVITAHGEKANMVKTEGEPAPATFSQAEELANRRLIYLGQLKQSGDAT